MTEEQLQAIKMRAKYATDGPWKVVKSEESGVQIGTVWEHGQLKAGVPIVTTAHGKGGVTVYINHVNAEFIAHAREDVPTLIAEVELQKANAKQYLKDNVELYNENLILKNEIQRLNIALDRTELAEAKARMEIERLREIIKNAGCAMAEGENGDTYRYLYNGIGNGDYNYFERINEEEEKKFSEAIKRRLDGKTK